jgi:hypothetical protein
MPALPVFEKSALRCDTQAGAIFKQSLSFEKKNEKICGKSEK